MEGDRLHILSLRSAKSLPKIHLGEIMVRKVEKTYPKNNFLRL